MVIRARGQKKVGRVRKKRGSTKQHAAKHRGASTKRNKRGKQDRTKVKRSGMRK